MNKKQINKLLEGVKVDKFAKLKTLMQLNTIAIDREEKNLNTLKDERVMITERLKRFL